MSTQARAFDPDAVQPKAMDFTAFLPREKSEKVQKKQQKQQEKAAQETKTKGSTQPQGPGGIAAPGSISVQSLPKRLSLEAFSTQVGWRPTGLNSGQVRLFVERFPT